MEEVKSRMRRFAAEVTEVKSLFSIICCYVAPEACVVLRPRGLSPSRALCTATALQEDATPTQEEETRLGNEPEASNTLYMHGMLTPLELPEVIKKSRPRADQSDASWEPRGESIGSLGRGVATEQEVRHIGPFTPF
ncbi:hypothetical protein EYF80_053553 [Liparis tanakae]|uniref:Uncharacterized protein n=1 Tax=Liparis tanakae TaxID=230148 RepID=A0A4Z2F606_9TELE|nr:hypothetical protein EYF80_053553 [Liparis tanakae]